VSSPLKPRRQRPRRVFTGRALVLGAAVVLLLVLLASPLNRFFGSRGDVNAAASQLQRDRAELAQLQAQLQRWSDPGYVQEQARHRLQYAMPGDTVYVTVDKSAVNKIQATSTPKRVLVQGSWNQLLWKSVEQAGG
jgi:cell division protein FtsB